MKDKEQLKSFFFPAPNRQQTIICFVSGALSHFHVVSSMAASPICGVYFGLFPKFQTFSSCKIQKSLKCFLIETVV